MEKIEQAKKVLPPEWALDWLPTWSMDTLLGVSIWQWLGLLSAIFIGLVLKSLTESFVRMAQSLSSHREESLHHRFFQAFEKPVGLLSATAFWYLSIHQLGFKDEIKSALTFVTSVLFGISLIWAAYKLIDILSFTLGKWAERTENDFDDHLVPLLIKSFRIFVVLLGTLVLIQNLGFNVMSLLAGLGLGGLAFALAAKDTAANLFGSIMILIDRPFRIGDWIVTNEGEGHVEEIGFRSTRIRTFYDSLISVPNSIMATVNIDNMGQRSYRRIKEHISVTYDTSPEKMEAFLEGIKQIILANPHTRKDKFHIVFDRFGASSLDILLYCFVFVPDWAEELYQKQNIFLEILRLAKKLQIEFAFPTQTLHVESFPEKRPSREAIELSESDLRQIPKDFGSQGKSTRVEGLGYYRPHFRDMPQSESTAPKR